MSPRLTYSLAISNVIRQFLWRHNMTLIRHSSIRQSNSSREDAVSRCNLFLFLDALYLYYRHKHSPVADGCRSFGTKGVSKIGRGFTWEKDFPKETAHWRKWTRKALHLSVAKMGQNRRTGQNVQWSGFTTEPNRQTRFGKQTFEGDLSRGIRRTEKNFLRPAVQKENSKAFVSACPGWRWWTKRKIDTGRRHSCGRFRGLGNSGNCSWNSHRIVCCMFPRVLLLRFHNSEDVQTVCSRFYGHVARSREHRDHVVMEETEAQLFRQCHRKKGRHVENGSTLDRGRNESKSQQLS